MSRLGERHSPVEADDGRRLYLVQIAIEHYDVRPVDGSPYVRCRDARFEVPGTQFRRLHRGLKGLIAEYGAVRGDG